MTLVGSLLDTRVTLLTLTTVGTRLESSRTIYHIYYILLCAKQDKRAAFSIPVKSVSFKSFDYRQLVHVSPIIARISSSLAIDHHFIQLWLMFLLFLATVCQFYALFTTFGYFVTIFNTFFLILTNFGSLVCFSLHFNFIYIFTTFGTF